MDLTTQTLDSANNNTKTTPPTLIHHPTTTTTPDPSKSLSFTPVTLKRTTVLAPPPPQPQPPSSMVVAVSYKECLKNHAASIGGHALDGCGEFMPSSSTNPSDPRSLKCAACGCHRNFHRREPQENDNLKSHKKNPTFLNCIYSSTPSSAPAPLLSHRAMSQSTSPSLSSSPSHSPSPMSSPSPPPLSHVPPYHASAPHMLLALGSAYSSALPSSDEHHHHNKNLNFSMMMKSDINNNSSKKRYRTKFSKEQKEKMQSFSDKLGWRMQKGDDGLVHEFCNEIGVSRGVFKVWMHNNKNTLRKKSDQDANGNANANATESTDLDGANANGGGFDSDINNPYNPNSSNNNNDNNDIHMNEGNEEDDGCVNNNVHVSLNEMSS